MGTSIKNCSLLWFCFWVTRVRFHIETRVPASGPLTDDPDSSWQVSRHFRDGSTHSGYTWCQAVCMMFPSILDAHEFLKDKQGWGGGRNDTDTLSQRKGASGLSANLSSQVQGKGVLGVGPRRRWTVGFGEKGECHQLSQISSKSEPLLSKNQQDRFAFLPWHLDFSWAEVSEQPLPLPPCWPSWWSELLLVDIWSALICPKEAYCMAV